MKKSTPKHIVIDARGRKSGVGRPVSAFLQYIDANHLTNKFTVLVEPSDDIDFKSKNITVVVCKYKRFSMNPFEQLAFSLFLYKLKPDLVYFTMTGIAPLLYFGKNITFTHDLTMLRFARAGRLPGWVHKIRMLGYRLLFWKGNKFTKHIVVPSKFVKEDLSRYLPSSKHKISVVYEAGDLPKVDKAKKPSGNINKPFIMHAGSPFPHKNIENLVLAFENLKVKNPNLKLVLVGKKEHYFEKLEEWIKDRQYKNDIIITGFVSDGELRWLLENADCYVLPSLSEGFGLPGLEAMANGCPVASSNATCLPEIYENSVLYFDPLDVDDMGEAIRKIISEKKTRQELIKKGYAQFDKYSWDKMSKEILDIINKQFDIK